MMSLISSLAVLAMSVMVIVGYWKVWTTEGSPIMRALTVGVLVLGVSMLLRSTYWDLIQFGLGREKWIVFRDALGGQEVSTFFNLLTAVGLGYILEAKRRMIPEEDRSKYRWWNAWRYPPSEERYSVRKCKRGE